LKVTFGDVTLDSDSRQVFRGKREVRVSPKAFDLLTLLVENRPRAVSKQELLERLWPSTYVSETSLATLVREIRAALDDDAKRASYIRTVHRFGYAFCAAVQDLGTTAQGASSASVGSWLISDARQIPLGPGENIIGREAGAAAWIDSPSVSRRHARILISGNQATLEDLGSKNGTYVRGVRLTAPSALVDGDEIHLGSAIVTFRMPSRAGSTITQSTQRQRTRS
jgi:DNA-binding winged helix-turn-helix (wHTH) protein